MNETAMLSASLEDYLEAIYNIIREKQAVRAKDIAARLKVSNASVTGALRALAKRNLLNYAPYDVITLTPTGEEIARDVVRRHEILKDFFTKVLAVDPAEADIAACKLEHDIPPDILERLVQFIEFIEICPLGGEKLIQGFLRHLDCGTEQGECQTCISKAKALLAGHEAGASSSDSIPGTLAELTTGDRARIKKIRARGTLRKRLIEMGLVPGAAVEVERVAPMGDPVEVKVRGYHISLRKEEAEHVEVE